MAAPQIVVLLPAGIDNRAVLGRMVEELSLTVDHVPSGSPFDFSAQRRDESAYLLVEYDTNVSDFIDELASWERPTEEYKRLLSDCTSSITMHYRGIDIAKRSLKILSATIGYLSSRCIIENGCGCLLLLSDVVNCIAVDPTWTWERERFPEIAGVAPSEWLA